jgi:diazepam-binding inhibitor (GABA receptor modulating acyl-CoA-binding protein)
MSQMGFGFVQEEFQEHSEKAKTLPENTTNENKLILYGLYKQATVGPVNTSEYFAPLR